MKIRPLDKYQKAAMGLMSLMVLLTFALANVQALLWQASDTLVGAVLPGVVVELTNEERDDVAAAPLQRNSALDAAAQLKAEHMAENGYFAHFAPDGTSPWFWFDEAGYTYAHAGENLAVHFTDSAEVVEAWMDSPTHRANIVDRKFTEIGVGTAKGRLNGHRTVFVVQLFGAPGFVPPSQVATAAESAQLAVADTPVAQEPTPAADDASPVLAAEATTETPVTPPEPVAVVEPVPESTPEPVEESNPTPAPTPEPVESPATPAPANIAAAPEPLATEAVSGDLAVRQSMVATSSGLAVANTSLEAPNQPVSFLALATQPSTVMQVVYTLIALAVFLLLVIAFVNEMQHAHPIQMGYSVAMLLLMTGLYWLHTTLTQGAIVV